MPIGQSLNGNPKQHSKDYFEQINGLRNQLQSNKHETFEIRRFIEFP
jgi:hypothetical protein